jgi:hypothetical protein
MPIVPIDRNAVIPILTSALEQAKHGEVTHATVVLVIDGEVHTFMSDTESKYEDAGILVDVVLERLGYMPAEVE